LENPEVFADRILAALANNTFPETTEYHVLPSEKCPERWLEHWSQPISSGLFRHGRIEHYHDITDRKIAERAVIESERKFRAFFESSPDPIYVIDQELRIVDVNGPGCRLVSDKKNKLVGRFFNELAPHDKRSELANNLTKLRRKPSESLAFVVKTVSGMTIDVEIRLSLYFDQDKEVILLHIRDITERKKLEQQLLQSQKMDAIGRLAGGIAHDFNNLLMGILGYCECLLGELPESSIYRDEVVEIEKAGEKAAELTRQLLAFSRKQTIEPTVLKINEIVNDMEKLLARMIGPDIQLKTRKQKNLWLSRCDRTQFEQVIMNLAVNAKEAMPEGGRLIVQTKNISINSGNALVRKGIQPGDYICVTIRDTGTGMDAAIKSHAFEPFFTTKEVGKGTGLGLATVYGIIVQNNGHIFISSRENKGTVFAIYLPRAEEKEKSKGMNPSADVENYHGCGKVLLVEDEDVVRSFTRILLTKKGYSVLEASQPEEAIQLSELPDTDFDLLITDVIMPKMNGQRLALHLRKSRPALKVVFISGYSDEAIDTDFLIDGQACFLQKPFKAEELMDAISGILDPVDSSGESR
jgi:PAS domain S-box-containing protein